MGHVGAGERQPAHRRDDVDVAIVQIQALDIAAAVGDLVHLERDHHVGPPEMGRQQVGIGRRAQHRQALAADLEIGGPRRARRPGGGSNATTSKPSSGSLSRAARHRARSARSRPRRSAGARRRGASAACLTASRASGTRSATRVQLVAHQRREKLLLVRNTSAASTIARVTTTPEHVADLLPERPPARIVAEPPEARPRRRCPSVTKITGRISPKWIWPVVPGRVPGDAAEPIVHRPSGDEAGEDHRPDRRPPAARPRARPAASASPVDVRSPQGRPSHPTKGEVGFDGRKPAPRNSAERFALARLDCDSKTRSQRSR